MFEKINSAKNRTIAFTRRHRTAITITATTAACYTVHRHVVEGFNEFLNENDLMDKFNAFAEAS